MQVARADATLSLLTNGKLLVAGYASQAELYDPGLGYAADIRPQITTVTSPFSLGGALNLSGSKFRGTSEASSGGFQSSPTDYPLLEIRNVGNEQTAFVPVAQWSTTNVVTRPLWNFPPGYALATVFVNGVPGTSSVVSVTVPTQAAPIVLRIQHINGDVQISFTNHPRAVFGVRAASSIEQPLSEWSVLDGATEIAPGEFRFSEPRSYPKRFYQVYSY